MERAVEQLTILRDLRPSTQYLMAVAFDLVDAAHSYSGNTQTDPAAELYKPSHNGKHTRNVTADTLKACDASGIMAGFGREIAAATAPYHDVVHELDSEGDENEQQSIVVMHDVMRSAPYQYNESMYEYSKLAILGTFVDKAGHMLVQRAVAQKYPTKIAEKVAFALAAADLGRLYTPDGPYLAHKYHQERTTGASGIAPSIDSVIPFQELQLILLDGNYKYPTPELAKAFKSHEAEVRNYNEKLLEDLQAGRIQNWSQLLQKDLAFMQANQ